MSSPALLMAADLALRTDLGRVARERVCFGHQSVGANLLQGVEELAAQAGVPVRIVRAEHASELPAATFVHTFIPENGKPLEKLESFRRALGDPPFDLALLKFCYVDIRADTDVEALFRRYQQALDELKRSHPHTVFVHVTLIGVLASARAPQP